MVVDTFYVGHISYCSNIEVSKVPNLFYNAKPASYSNAMNPRNNKTISRTLIECSHLLYPLNSIVRFLLVHTSTSYNKNKNIIVEVFDMFTLSKNDDADFRRDQLIFYLIQSRRL